MLITGKGRCNITSSLPINEFINNIPGNGKFLYSAFQNFTNEDIINFMKEENVEIKEERGNRIFPVSDKAQDVLNAFIKKLKESKVDIKTNVKVKEILVENIDEIDSKIKKVVGVKLQDGNILKADKIILATGGKSYPITGSTRRWI